MLSPTPRQKCVLGRSPGAALALIAVLVGAPGASLGNGASRELDRLPQGLTLYVLDNFRWELWRFFDPGPPGGDPNYDFLANRLRFGLRYDRSLLRFHAAGQYVQLLSLPANSIGTPGGVLGTGAAYFGHAGKRNPWALQLKYLNAELRDPFDLGLTLTGGRFGYASGRQADSGIAKLETLKKSRIADRLIGEFAWSHFQRSFDGVHLRWDHGFGQASAAWLRPTEGGFEEGWPRQIEDIDVVSAAYTVAPDRLVPRAELQAFYSYYDDTRRVQARVDNTGLPPRPRLDLAIHTLGVHLVGAWSAGPGELDLLGWGSFQTGHWFELDHRAAAGALEIGYQLDGLPGRPWLRIGAFRSTGDGSPSDGRHETFFQMLPTARLYSLTATYNLMNSTDSFVELRLAPTSRLKLRADLHDLRLSERRDLWYAGSGATQRKGRIFGYAGRPSGGNRHLGTVVEITARYRLADFLTLHAFYGHLWGGDVVRTSFARDDELDFFFLEITLRASVRGRPRQTRDGAGSMVPATAQ